MVASLMNNELKGSYRELIEVTSWNLPGGIEKITIGFIRDTWLLASISVEHVQN
jgi:hypothetical protein